jgi:hypothetical protein
MAYLKSQDYESSIQSRTQAEEISESNLLLQTSSKTTLTLTKLVELEPSLLFKINPGNRVSFYPQVYFE